MVSPTTRPMLADGGRWRLTHGGPLHRNETRKNHHAKPNAERDGFYALARTADDLRILSLPAGSRLPEWACVQTGTGRMMFACFIGACLHPKATSSYTRFGPIRSIFSTTLTKVRGLEIHRQRWLEWCLWATTNALQADATIHRPRHLPRTNFERADVRGKTLTEDLP